MSPNFIYDVFISCSKPDQDIARELAARLQSDGLEVWLEQLQIKPHTTRANRAGMIEDALEKTRTLLFCFSAHASGAEWTPLESLSFRFRDPQNPGRYFIPLRLDASPLPDSLTQTETLSWLPELRQQEYPRLLEACRPPAKAPLAQAVRSYQVQKFEEKKILSCVFTSDGLRALMGNETGTIQLWDLQEGQCLRVFTGHQDAVYGLELSSDERKALSGSNDKTIRLWDLETAECLRTFEGHDNRVIGVAWSHNNRFALSASFDKTLRLWDVESGACQLVLKNIHEEVASIAWSHDDRRALSGDRNGTILMWDLETGDRLCAFKGHTQFVNRLLWSQDDRFALSAGDDSTIRLWELESGRCLRVLEGHEGWVGYLAWRDDRFVLSSSRDRTLRLWDLASGRCLRSLVGHTAPVRSLSWSADGRRASSADESGLILDWDLSEFFNEAGLLTLTGATAPTIAEQVQYTNAKVLLVGDTSAGKTGLSMRLALDTWQPSDSTIGAWATQWKLTDVSPAGSMQPIEREIWLWDFGGQADQRLVHQLYMEDTALAVLVFDGQKADVFESLGQWDRDLGRASSKPFTKLLAAGRVDAGGLRVSRSQLETFARERGYSGFLETSAKENRGCQELKEAILAGIRWDQIPWHSSPLLFKLLKEEILKLKDEGRVLMRFNELRDNLNLRLSAQGQSFKEEELKAVIGLMAGPGIVWELAFGGWVLLQPECINAYAQAVIRTLRADKFERGCLPEEQVLNGELDYPSSMKRIDPIEERFVLMAMLQSLVGHGLCLRQQTNTGPLLVFPSYYRRERPELVGHPAVLVSYRFNGFLDDIYATLVVKLNYTGSFEQDELWLYAADFTTETGKQLGVKLTRRAEGAGELEVYFDPSISLEVKIIFSRYVHEHLLQKAQDVVRLRHYVCPHCGTPVASREVAMQRLGAWLAQQASGAQPRSAVPEQPTILCVNCEKRVPLWDEMEQCFASPELQDHVRLLQEQAQVVLDSESKERALVGEVTSTVALAGQISREITVSDWGIDVEIEFKDDRSQATGRKLYLQLKSGDSFLHKRRKDGSEVFSIKNERHVKYWMDQAFPVFLVIRTSEGEVRWMEIRDWLKQKTQGGKVKVKQITFEGERFDVMSVRRWREKALMGFTP